MSTAVANRTQAAPLAERFGLTPEKLHLIRQQVAPNAPDDVLELYFERCRLAGADPFARMFYATSRNVKKDDKWETRWQIETTIDGFRSIAESTGEYDGQDEPIFAYKSDGSLEKCTVTVYRKGMSRGVTAVAYWSEYVQLTRDGKVGPMWAKMPHGQLAKCCEALALRKAFPRQLSGIYTNDEMAQAGNPEPRNVTPNREQRPAKNGNGKAAPTEDDPTRLLTADERKALNKWVDMIHPDRVVQLVTEASQGRASSLDEVCRGDARAVAEALRDCAHRIAELEAAGADEVPLS